MSTDDDQPPIFPVEGDSLTRSWGGRAAATGGPYLQEETLHHRWLQPSLGGYQEEHGLPRKGATLEHPQEAIVYHCQIFVYGVD